VPLVRIESDRMTVSGASDVSLEAPVAFSLEPSLQPSDPALDIGQAVLSNANARLRPYGVQIYVDIEIGYMGKEFMAQTDASHISGTILVPVVEEESGAFLSLSRVGGALGVYPGNWDVMTEFSQPEPNVGAFVMIPAFVEVAGGISAAGAYNMYILEPGARALQNEQDALYNYVKFNSEF
jgi:hypothetical protein